MSLFGSKKQIKGYRYYMGVHMGVCRGPVDELVQINVGTRPAWKGRVVYQSFTVVQSGISSGGGSSIFTRNYWRIVPGDGSPVADNETLMIAAAGLFGGDDKEGGISGTLDLMMGAPTQAINTGLHSMLGGPLISAFRGIVTLFFNGLIAANSPYPKKWEIRVRRTSSGWDGAPWYTAKSAIWLGTGNGTSGIKAGNGAHILYECYTNRDWGRGLPASRLNEASFLAAADKLYAEGFGLCLSWNRQSSISEFIQVVLNHIGGGVATDPTSGKITLKLIRGDYDAATLPLFTFDTGLLGIDEERASSSEGACNEMIVNWLDPVTNKKKSVRRKNTGAIQAAGGLNTTTKDYPGLPTYELAARVAARDLRASQGDIKRYKIRLDRRAYAIQPGDAFRISEPSRGLNDVVLRAGRVDDGEITDGTITITALQDVFGLPASSFGQPQPSGWVAPDPTPQPLSYRQIMEAPYTTLAGLIAAADLAAMPATDCYVTGIAARPTTTLATDFVVADRIGSAQYIVNADGAFSATGVTSAAATPMQAAVTLSCPDLDFIVIGSAALWENEIVRVVTIDAATGATTLARGCADTVPVAHAAGTRLWFYDGNGGTVPIAYASGETIDVKLLSRTGTDILDPALAPTDNLVFSQRQARPYPPGNFKINTVAYPAVMTGDLTVSWAHRDRLVQSSQLVDTTAASIGPEAGTTYTVTVYGDTGTLIHTESGLSGTTWTYSTEATGTLNSNLRVTLEAIRSGIISYQKHDLTFDRAGFGLSFGKYFGGVTP